VSKTTIGRLYGLALFFEIIFTIVFFAVYASTADSSAIENDQFVIQYDQQQLQQDQGNSYPSAIAQDQQRLTQDQQQLTRDQQQVKLPFLITSLIFMVGASILGMIAWIGALINLSRGEQWAWFILMFFFGGITLLIYLIGGPAVPAAGQTPVRQQWASGLQGNAPPAVAPQMASPLVPQPSPQPSAIDIAQQRFARGEIDAETYRQMLATLAGKPASPVD
jgi:hypothetical protein